MKGVSKQLKSVPSLPAGMAELPKEEIGRYLIFCIDHSVGIALRSVLLERQRLSCCSGVTTTDELIASAQNDETAQQYGQIMQEEIGSALDLLDDHLRIFFIACQLHVTRIVQSVRWFDLLAGELCALPRAYEADNTIRQLGAVTPNGMTMAECLWHLGNFAKHDDEIEDFAPATKDGLTKLGVLGGSEENKLGALNAILRGVTAASGMRIDSLEELPAALQTIERLLTEWGTGILERLIDDVDQYSGRDRGRTRRETEEMRRAFERLGRKAPTE